MSLRELLLAALIAGGSSASPGVAASAPEPGSSTADPSLQSAPQPPVVVHAPQGPQKAAEASLEYNPLGKRDPFRPLALERKTVADASETLSPLQRYDIGQLKLVGLIYDSSPPRAMVEDSAGLGFIITPGTPVGPNGGLVTSIRLRQVLIEEWYSDIIGERHRREIVLELPIDRADPHDPRTTEARK